MLTPLRPTFVYKVWALVQNIWRDYFAPLRDPHNKVTNEARDEASEGATTEDYEKATAALQRRFNNRDTSVTRTQEVTAFQFNGIAALFVMIGAGMMTTVAFFSWMGLLLLPSFFLAVTRCGAS